MCDFHSIIVRRDGAIFHIPENSHSGAVAASGWRENQPHLGQFFHEAEWDGDGEFPGVDRITRGADTLNEKQRRVIETHYAALAKLLQSPADHAERMLFEAGIFAGEEYADIRWRVLIHPDCPKRVADKLVVRSLHTNGEAIKSLDPRVVEVSGDLVIASGYEVFSPALTTVGGNLGVYGTAKLDALTTVGGYLGVSGTAKLDAPVLTKVGGNLGVYGTAKLDALTTVGGSLDVYGTAKLDAPVLTKVGGNLDVSGTAKLDALTTVGGNLDVSGTAKLDALTTVGGYLGVYGTAKLDAPVLTKVGGYLDVSGTAKLDALTTVGGYLGVYGTAKLDAPVLTKVGGYLDVSGTAKLDAPKLKRK